MALKYTIGDRVRIKSIDWYYKTKNEYDNVDCGSTIFIPDMVKYCGEIVTISSVLPILEVYHIKEDGGMFNWTDEMIEELVEEETKPKFKVGDRVIVRDASGIWEITNVEDNILYTIKRENHTFTLTTYGGFLTLYEGISDKMIESKVEEGVKNWADVSIPDGPYTVTYDSPSKNDSMSKNNIHNEIVLPKGYIFKDENGNVINTNKIVLEKKKKEYPKTYEECCKIFGLNHYLGLSWNSYDEYSGVITGLPKRIDDIAKKLESLSKLIICRDAYWKLYGEEMGLGKPWEPDYDSGVNKYGIICMNGVVQESNPTTNWERHLNKVLDFPTAEMRDTFKKNFDPDIEFCKELL